MLPTLDVLYPRNANQPLRDLVHSFISQITYQITYPYEPNSIPPGGIFTIELKLFQLSFGVIESFGALEKQKYVGLKKREEAILKGSQINRLDPPTETIKKEQSSI